MNKKNATSAEADSGTSARLSGLPAVLRKKQVLRMIGLSASTVYSMQKAGVFPQPIKLSPRTTGWLTSDIERWLASRAAERAA
jgi:prophage regulatory protein